MRPDVVFSLGSSLTLSHQSASSFFESGLARDSTWFNPRSRLPHCPTTASSALVPRLLLFVETQTPVNALAPQSSIMYAAISSNPRPSVVLVLGPAAPLEPLPTERSLPPEAMMLYRSRVNHSAGTLRLTGALVFATDDSPGPSGPPSNDLSLQDLNRESSSTTATTLFVYTAPYDLTPPHSASLKSTARSPLSGQGSR